MTRPFPRPTRRNFPPSKPAIDLSRVNHIADLLAQGATVAPFGTAGRMGLSLGGKVVSTTDPAVLQAAREMGQEGML